MLPRGRSEQRHTATGSRAGTGTFILLAVVVAVILAAIATGQVYWR